MAVGVQSNRHLGMAEPLTDDLRMNIGAEHERRVAVPKIVKPNSWQFGRRQKVDPGVCDALRLLRFAVLSGADEGVVGEPHAELQQLFGLVPTMGTKSFHHHGR